MGRVWDKTGSPEGVEHPDWQEWAWKLLEWYVTTAEDDDALAELRLKIAEDLAWAYDEGWAAGHGYED